MKPVRTLIKGGTVVTMDDSLGDLETANVLIEGSKIVAVGPELEAEGEVIDATGCIVMPGLVESHSHLWQGALRGVAAEFTTGGEYFGTVHPRSGRFSAEDMYAATYSVAIELLSLGATTVFDYCHSVNSPEHADASVEALKAAGIRAVFGNSFRDRPEYQNRAFHSLDERVADARRLRDSLGDDGLVTMAVCLNNIEEADEEATRKEILAARDLGVLAAVHSNFPGQVDLIDSRGLLGPEIQWVHGLTMTDTELRKIADIGGLFTITPEPEAMDGVYPVTGRALEAGLTVGIGCDIPAAVNANVIGAARYALQVERSRVSRLERFEGREPGPQRDRLVTPGAMLRLATAEGAKAVGLGDRTGRLAPGLCADVVIFDTRPCGRSQGSPAAHIVMQSHPGQIRLVMVDGEVRFREGRLVDVDYADAEAKLHAARVNVGGDATPLGAA